MSEDILFNPEEEKAKEEQTQSQPDLNSVLETLNNLKSTLETVNTRLDDFDARLNSFTTQPTQQTTQESWRPQTWDDIPKKAEEIAEEVVEQKLEEIRLQEEEQKKLELEQQKKMDEFIDAQVAQLEQAGVLPKIQNMNDENDKGRVARRELFGLAARLGTIDLAKAAEVLNILHQAGYVYDPRAKNGQGDYIRSNTTPFGINSPVGSSSKSTGFFSSKPSYQEIHQARSLDELVRKALGE